jgi:hypothetical protein
MKQSAGGGHDGNEVMEEVDELSFLYSTRLHPMG